MIVIQYILFALTTTLLAFVYPISGYYQQKKFVKENSRISNSKISWYKESMLWAWTPTIIIVTVIILCGFELQDIGIRPINLSAHSLRGWIVYPSVFIFLIYFGYNIYSIIVLKFSKESRKHSLKQLPCNLISMLPVTKKEKRVWSYVAVTAGITEEIQYRGYIFFAIPLLFPGISVAIVLAISTFLFGIGHIYQGKSAIRPTLAGLLFGSLYIVFDSIIPIILLHIVQDLVVRDLLDE